MRYQIDVKGMHCVGCVNLIKMALEEGELENITVSLEENKATFDTTKNFEVINDLLNRAFLSLEHYSYSGLKLV